ncbi:MAG TPA: SH3 domain-containing protein [Thermomicrobiales bacterium]|nr:SH3 domain-containing protein [Thermomicrobiales bacterium]
MRNDSHDPLLVTMDRRVILKAAAALGAMSLVGTAEPRAASAQAPETAADTFVEGDAFRATEAVNEPYTFEANFPFYAAGAHWDGSVTFPVLIEMSFSLDGSSFSEPIYVGAAEEDAGRPDRSGRHFSDLAFTEAARFVRYRTLDGNGDPAQLAGFQITYIDASPGPSVDMVYAAALAPSVARPPVISRSDWGANESYRYDASGEIWPTEYAPVEHVIIHHTETANFQDPLIAIRSIYYYHAVTRGWGDIGYNYLVDFMGNVYEGRAGGENVVGGHAYQYAEGSSGIGTIGNFSFQDTTPETQAGVVWITSYAARNLDPLAVKNFKQIPGLPTICGHRDVNYSSCPGDYLYDDLPTIRQYAAAVINEGGNPSPAEGAVSEGDIVTTTVDLANMRTKPGLQASVKAQLPLGTILTITDGPTTTDGYTWFGVTAGRYGDGWVASIVFGEEASPPPPPTPGAFRIGDSVRVATDRLNLRTAPSLAGSIVAGMPFGTGGSVTGGPRDSDGYTWYQLQTPVGSGWAAGAFLERSGQTTPPPASGTLPVGSTVAVDTDALNMRSSASTRAAIVATLPTNAVLTITGGPTSANGYTWYSVTSVRYGHGWVAGEFLRLTSGGDPAPEPVPDPPPGGTYPVGTALVVATDGLNMRAGPSLGRSVIATLPRGTRVEVTDTARTAEGYVWYGVYAGSYGGGWCAAQYLAPATGSPPTPDPVQPPTSGLSTGDRANVTGGRLNIRSAPSISASILGVAEDGTIFEIRGTPTTADGYRWYPVRNARFPNGWCAGEFLQEVT